MRFPGDGMRRNRREQASGSDLGAYKGLFPAFFGFGLHRYRRDYPMMREGGGRTGSRLPPVKGFRIEQSFEGGKVAPGIRSAAFPPTGRVAASGLAGCVPVRPSDPFRRSRPNRPSSRPG